MGSDLSIAFARRIGSNIVPKPSLLLALAASVAVHIAAYLATPRWVVDFTPVKTVRYDASLVPIKPTTTPQQSKLTPTKHVVKRRAASTPPADAPNLTPPDDVLTPPVIDAAALLASATQPTESPPIAPDEIAPAPTTTDTPPQVQASVPKPVAPAFAERISIDYKLTSSITDGTANFKWTRKGSAYEIESSTQASGFLVAAFAGVIYQQSRGEITDEGLRPTLFSIRRGDGEAETADFERATNSLIFKRRKDSRTVPLNRDMQDMQSFLFQLAYDAPRLAATGDKLDVLVTNARKVYRYQFKKMGEDIIETRMGKIETIRLLSEAANPEDAYEVWLAPKFLYLPVKLKLYLGRFPIEQIATRIGVSGD